MTTVNTSELVNQVTPKHQRSSFFGLRDVTYCRVKNLRVKAIVFILSPLFVSLSLSLSLFVPLLSFSSFTLLLCLSLLLVFSHYFSALFSVFLLCLSTCPFRIEFFLCLFFYLSFTFVPLPFFILNLNIFFFFFFALNLSTSFLRCIDSIV